MNVDKLYNQFNRLRPNPYGTIKHDGDKLKPNQKCPCGSGKKYKKCCQQRLELIAKIRGSNVVTQKEVMSK